MINKSILNFFYILKDNKICIKYSVSPYIMHINHNDIKNEISSHKIWVSINKLSIKVSRKSYPQSSKNIFISQQIQKTEIYSKGIFSFLSYSTRILSSSICFYLYWVYLYIKVNFLPSFIPVCRSHFVNEHCIL